MKKISNGWLATIIIATVIILDQASKIYVKTHFFLGETVDVASWFKITFIENNGMAYGMELGSKMVLTWLRIIFSGLFIYYLVKISRRHRKCHRLHRLRTALQRPNAHRGGTIPA